MDFLKRTYVAFLLLVVCVVAGGAGACGFEPQIGEGAFSCAADRSCPNGFVCAGDNKCYRPGNGPAVTSGDGGQTDSSTPEVLSKVQADPIGLPEGNSSAPTDFVFTIRLEPPSTKEVTLDYATNDGTAKVNEDFAGAAGKLIFPPGSTSQTVTVKVTADRFEEPDETFTLHLSNITNAELLAGATPDVTATIKNDDSPGLAIDDITVTEGDVDSTATLTVSLSGAYTTDVTVNFATGAGTALAGSDYFDTSDLLTFAPGDKTKQVVVPIKGDLAHEQEETFTVKLTNPQGAPLVDDEAIVKIADNDPIPTISVADATIAEGDVGETNMTFVVTLSAASTEEVKVTFATGGGTAATTDYSSTSGTLTFPAGTTSQNISVPVNGDLTDENDETFMVTLSAPVNATLAKAIATGTITDDDGAPVLTVGDVALAEGNAGTKVFSFPFTLSTASSKTVSIAWATANGTATAGSDYTAASGIVTFTAGETTKMVDVTVTGDAVAEPAETFALTLTNATNVTAPASPPTGTIINDDGATANLSIGDATVAEGNAGTKVLSFSVTCTGAGSGITVNYATTNGTASAGTDFVAASGTLGPFNCGNAQTIDVTINGDTAHEGDETFSVNLSNPSADVAITDSQGVGTITNDDSQPTINIVSAVNVAEGNVGSKVFGFDVTLTNPSSTNVTVNYATSNNNFANPATAGTDYVTTSGTLTFAPGETTKTVNVTVNGDAVFELDEQFRVTLSANSANSSLGTAVGVGTITNDETQPTVSINDVTLTEGNSGSKNFTFTLTLSGTSYQAISVNYATSNGTATAGSDYTAKSGTVTFNAGGALTQTVNISVTGDTTFEPDETFNITLSTPVNTTISDGTGVGTITNDDQARLITINDVTVTENNGNGYIRFTVSLSPAVSGTTSVAWALVHGTTSNADFSTVTLSGIASIAGGSTSTTITLNLNNDNLDEVDETFEIQLSNPTNQAQIADGIGIGTITDDDPTPSLSIVGPASPINEGNSGTQNFTFNVTLSAASGRTVTVQYATSDGDASGTGSRKDYEPQNGTLTFAPGETSKQINVVVYGDTRDENDETFNVTLSNPVGATLNVSTDNATIKNDD